MRVCPKCKKEWKVNESKVPQKGVKLHCKKCGHNWSIYPKSAGREAINKSVGKNADHSPGVHHGKGTSSGVSGEKSHSAGKEKIVVNKGKGAGSTGFGGAIERLSIGRKLSELMNDPKKKRICTAVIVVLLLTVQIQPLRSIIYENRLFTTFDQKAEDCIDDSFKRALIAFGAARAINSLISVIQDSQVSISPAGLGFTIALGEALDPVNDLVERFSWIMMASLVALSIQKLFIQIGPWLSLKFMLSITLCLFLTALWTSGSFRNTFVAIAKKALIATFILRFAVPLATYVNSLTYYAILDKHYESASDELQYESNSLENIKIGEEINSLSAGGEDQGFLSKAKSMWNGAKGSFDIMKKVNKITELKEKAGKLTENFIRLSVVFILNTVLLPIAFLWTVLKFTQMLLGRKFGLTFQKITN